MTTDNASYSDMVFGRFAILGYRLAPRFADLPDQRSQWPDMLRVAGSLVTDQVRLRPAGMFGRDGRPSPLGRAFIEYGRIAKRLHLLALVDPGDGTYPRRMNRQLTALGLVLNGRGRAVEHPLPRRHRRAVAR